MTKQEQPDDKSIDIVDAADDGKKTVAFTTSFTMTWKDRETEVVRVGTFTATRPGLGTLGKIAVLKAKLDGGEKIDPMNSFSHQMIADLYYILTDVPDWWKPDEFFTADPLRAVWDHVGAWIDSFRKVRAG